MASLTGGGILELPHASFLRQHKAHLAEQDGYHTTMNWDESTWDSGTWDSDPTSPPAFLFKKRKTKYKTMAANPTPEDDDFVSAGTTGGLEKTLEGYVPGVIVQVKVIPYNDGGDGPESPTGSVTVT